jgi:hypothetical protein
MWNEWRNLYSCNAFFLFFIVLLVGGGEMGGIRGGESGRIGIHATHFFYFSPISPLNL